MNALFQVWAVYCIAVIFVYQNDILVGVVDEGVQKGLMYPIIVFAVAALYKRRVRK